MLSDLLCIGKNAPHKSLRPDTERLAIQEKENLVTEEASDTRDTVEEDHLRASHSPALDDARELLGQNALALTLPGNETSQSRPQDNDVIEDQPLQYEDAGSLPPASSPATTETLADNVVRDPFEPTDPGHEHTDGPAEPTPVSPIKLQILSTEEPDKSARVPDVNPEGKLGGSLLPLQTPSRASPSLGSSDTPVPQKETSSPQIMKPRPSSTPKNLQTLQLSDLLSPGGSPQIGTSLLKRESLRRCNSPIKKREVRKSKSPQKKETLSRRDTIQEREILQQVIAETSQPSQIEDARDNTQNAEMAHGSQSEPAAQDSLALEENANPASSIEAERSSSNVMTGLEDNPNDRADASVGKDLQRAKEAIEVLEEPTSIIDAKSPLGGSAKQNEELKALDKANEIITAAEVEETALTADIKSQPDLPPRKTRSGTRFSDDTDMLRDFVNRTQATKAAKTPVLLPLDAQEPQVSPRRSPRKALGSHKGTPAKPLPATDVNTRPGTPPGVTKTDILEPDNAEEIVATPTSCRRSARTRLPAPSKNLPGAPSLIPLRRADGTDPVVLQKSEAQELAMTTRANTRRNKGQSKPPPIALKELPFDTSEGLTAKQHAENAKAVAWAEQLASYHESKEKRDEGEETRPKVRRVRGLGAGNGTPAPKKTAALGSSSNGTPAPKRRGKGNAKM